MVRVVYVGTETMYFPFFGEVDPGCEMDVSERDAEGLIALGSWRRADPQPMRSPAPLEG